MRFQRTVAGFNLSQSGITSYSRSLRLGKLANLNLNISGEGVSISASLPGTGLSTGSVRLLDLRPAPKRWAAKRRRINKDLER